MPDKKLKIFIIAGEVSGDVLGAKVIRAFDGGVGLSQPDQSKATLGQGCPTKTVQFAGVGGENMQAAGLESLFPISDLAVMGFIEVLGKARTLTRRIRETADAIIKFQPDIVLTIDSPSFAKAVIKKVKDKRTKIQKSAEMSFCPSDHLSIARCPLFYHIVAPQVWAWGAKRARKYAKIFDRLYCFFDFEKPYFEKYGLPTVAVGHPIADGLVPALHKAKGKGQKAITLIPGSRMSEVKKLLPIFKQVAEQITLSFVLCPSSFFIPTVETTREYIERETAGWAVRPTLIPAKDRY
ncbi:MAG: hypothetical protein LBJ18_02830, partial [Rickettsiales bacterium]|nr:hypothetical protein [Rickettsiales bacterium]